jgi:hypothetical protein
VCNDDVVWFNNSAKLNGIIDEIKNMDSSRELVCVFCFFENTAKAISDSLTNENIRFVTSGTSSVILLTTKNTGQYGRLNFATFEYQSKNIRFIIAEHYPILSEEQILLDKLEEFAEQKIAVTFHNSFDDPILKIFGSDNIKKMIQTLGLKENESLSHGMITKAIKNAQMKLSEKVKLEQKADSVEKWMELNVPN